MKTQVVGFDLEQYIPDGGNASIEHPISCAVSIAAHGSDSTTYRWYSGALHEPDNVMDVPGLNILIDHLLEGTRNGKPVVTWHGVAYDFPCMAYHSKRTEDMREIALASVDLHILFMAVSRHRLGLKAAAQAVGSHKGGGTVVSGSEAATEWPEAWEAVLEYCKQDVRATLDVYEFLEKNSYFQWLSSKGKLNQFTLPMDLRNTPLWTTENLLYKYQWKQAASWITTPMSPDDPMFDWLKG